MLEEETRLLIVAWVVGEKVRFDSAQLNAVLEAAFDLTQLCSGSQINEAGDGVINFHACERPRPYPGPPEDEKLNQGREPHPAVHLLVGKGTESDHQEDTTTDGADIGSVGAPETGVGQQGAGRHC